MVHCSQLHSSPLVMTRRTRVQETKRGQVTCCAAIFFDPSLVSPVPTICYQYWPILNVRYFPCTTGMVENTYHCSFYGSIGVTRISICSYNTFVAASQTKYMPDLAAWNQENVLFVIRKCIVFLNSQCKKRSAQNNPLYWLNCYT